MPTLAVRKDIIFHYTDSGPADQDDYPTLILVHGLTFHSTIFQKLLPIANSHSLRVICLNRRDYQGSSPYTDEEIRILQHGSDDEHASFIHEQGVLVALFVDGIIQTLSLPKAGGLSVVGWSMGNIFTLASRACIGDLPVETRERLKSYTRSFICWDSPPQNFGLPVPEQAGSEEEHLANFPKFISGYYKHADLDSKDPSKLDNTGDPLKKPTTETMTPEELSSVFDPTPCFRSEVPVLSFSLVLSKQRVKALMDPQVREDWGGGPVWHIFGDSNPAVIQICPWLLEDKIRSEDASCLSMVNDFKLIPDANHFLMWEEPDRFLTVTKECIPA